MPMRKYLASAFVLAWMATTPALADDLFSAPPSEGWYNNLLSKRPVSPPGPAKYARWRGLYAGAQVSFSDLHGDFGGSTSVPSAVDHSAGGFGGFVGYNFEYLTPDMNVVLGFEANYDWANIGLVTSISNGVTTTATGTVSNLDFATLRGRVGWGIDRFLPYAFVGFAPGNANLHFSGDAATGKDSAWLYGATAGVGLDVAVSPNFFLRTEYEYVQFQSLDGVALDINTVRLGGGVRF
jgi:outer membrane immunogenic protein